VSNSSLLSGGSFRRVLTIDADERTVTENSLPGLRVSPGFFAALGTRVLAGREFTASDVPGADDAQYRSAIVNESLARRYFPRGTAIGRRIGMGDQPDTRVEIEIVGVVEDISFRSIREPELEHFFLPFGHPSALSADGAFVLRVHGEPESMLAPVRAAVGEMDPGLPVDNLSTLEERVDHSLATERMLASLSSGFGGVALLLSIIGLYGLVSFVVLQRRQEIGVRVALGALRSDVVWLITRDVLLMTGIGIAVALPAAWALRRIVEAQLYGVAAIDPATLVFASSVLAVAAILAAVRPAWRAASIDPTEALRLE
jgi:predicted permease